MEVRACPPCCGVPECKSCCVSLRPLSRNSRDSRAYRVRTVCAACKKTLWPPTAQFYMQLSMTQLADLPPACLLEIAACLDLPSKCSWRLASRACCSSASMGSISITQSNVNQVVQATGHTWRNVSQADIFFTPAAAPQLDALCLGQWLSGLPDLTNLKLSIYCYEHGHEGEEQGQEGGSSSQEAVKKLLLQLIPIQTLTSLSISVSVEHGPTAAETSKAVTAAVCEALAYDAEQKANVPDDVHAAALLPSRSLALVTPAVGLTPQWLQRFASGLQCLTKLCGVRVQLSYHTEIQQLGNLPSLVHLLVTCVYISGDRGATCEAEVEGETQLGRVLGSMPHLQHLAVADFHGPTLPLLQELQQLPYLNHLSLAGQVWPHGPIASEQLYVLSTFPSLTALMVDRLHLSEAGGITLPGLQSLEVGLSVTGMLRLPHVFPYVQHAHLRWLWEGALLKLAGWQHLTSLSLTHLGYGNDWGLIRTLQALQELRLHHAGGAALLITLLQTAAQLPYLRLLAIAGWSLPPLTFSHQSLHTAGSDGCHRDDHQNGAQVMGQGGDVDDLTMGTRSHMGTGADLAPSTSTCCGFNGGYSATEEPDGQKLVNCFSGLNLLRRLEISNSSQSLVDVITETVKQGSVQFLQQLRLTHLPHLCAGQLQTLIAGLPGLNRLELGACGSPEAGGFRAVSSLVPSGKPGHVHVVWDVHEEMVSATDT